MLKELTEQCSWGTSADGYSVGSLSAPSPSQAMWPDRPSPGALTSCPNCLTDCDEANYCSGCGRTVKYEERGPKAHAGHEATLKEEL